MSNTKVLACQIDEELRTKMEEHRKNKKLTVKDYIIGLITEDLKKNAMLEDTKNNIEKQSAEKFKSEEQKPQSVEVNKKETIKSPLIKENKKTDSKKIMSKGKEKEEEEEFE